jgi:hypothetical protein
MHVDTAVAAASAAAAAPEASWPWPWALGPHAAVVTAVLREDTELVGTALDRAWAACIAPADAGRTEALVPLRQAATGAWRAGTRADRARNTNPLEAEGMLDVLRSGRSALLLVDDVESARNGFTKDVDALAPRWTGGCSELARRAVASLGLTGTVGVRVWGTRVRFNVRLHSSS